MHNTDLINIIIVPISVERDYAAPTTVQKEGIRVKQKGEGTCDTEDMEGLLSFLSFHHRGAGVKCHTPMSRDGSLYRVSLHYITHCHSTLRIP